MKKKLFVLLSQRQVQTSELIMLGRMFISEETARLEQMRQEAQAPPPPPPPPPSTPPTSTPPLAPVAPSVLPGKSDTLHVCALVFQA